MSSTKQEKEIAALTKLKQLVSDILEEKHDDEFLLRWLRARNNDPAKAEQMLRASLQWRKQKNVDSILEQFVHTKLMKRHIPLGHCGYDKEGCPVWIVPFGYYDVRGLLQSVKKYDLCMRVIYFMEEIIQRMKEQTKKLGRPIKQHYIIIDLEHFGIRHFMWKPAFDFMRLIVNLYDNNYPELLKTAMLINAPKIFNVAFALLKPFIHENTQQKIVLHGKDDWKSDVFQAIDPSQLPAHWGGTFTSESEDDYWWTVLSQPKEVPSSYFMNPARILAEESDTITVTVNKGGSVSIDIEVDEVGTTLKWLFQTEDNDIGFGVFLKTENGREEIIPIERMDTHLVPEDGTFICTKTGTYEVVFDNSFSYFRNKKVIYKMEEIPPNSTEEKDIEYTST